MANWIVIARPAEDTVSGKEKIPGLAVCLADVEGEDGWDIHEIARIAYRRKASENPNVTFVKQLEKTLANAEVVCGRIQELYEDAEAAEAESRIKARDEIRELLGGVPSGTLA